jgi:hypothetical protein
MIWMCGIDTKIPKSSNEVGKSSCRELFVVTPRGMRGGSWWGSRNFLSRGDRGTDKMGEKYFSPLRPWCNIKFSKITMVKKRIRDPEVLEEAPPAKPGADDSGSDDACPLSSHSRTPTD